VVAPPDGFAGAWPTTLRIVGVDAIVAQLLAA
jgi:hypothetical protein